MAPQPRVFLDFSVADQPLGRVVFELFSNVVPKTAEKALCTGELGLSKQSSIPLHYKGSIVHRVIDGFMIQGGDFTKRTGAGGESIYGGMFPDERLRGEGTEVEKAGLLIMANRGPDTNGSQWFVTLAAAPHLTGKHVVFGRVVAGMDHIQAIGHLPTDEKDRPLSRVVISHCGELELRKPAAAKPHRSPSPRKASPLSDEESDRSAPEKKSTSKSKKPLESDSDVDSSDEERERRRRRKERKAEKKERREKKDKKPREETEEELDTRLEREEKERLEKARLERLAEMKVKLEEERQRVKDSGGVVYKGRGAMRYLDPETTRHHPPPRNFDSRPQDIRSRRSHPYPSLQARIGGIEGKWQKGVAGGRPSFEGLDRDMDKYRRARTVQQDSRDSGDVRDTKGRDPSRSQSPRRAVGVYERDRSVSPAPALRDVRRSESLERRSLSPVGRFSPYRQAEGREGGMEIRGKARSESGSDMSMDRDD